MPWFGRLLVVAGILTAGLLVVLVAAMVQQVTRPPKPALPAVVETPPHVEPLSDAEIQRCAGCHSSVCEHYFETPHARTLTAAVGDEVFARFLGPNGDGRAVDETLPLFRYRRDGEVLAAIGGRTSEQVRVDWIFGSGRHAQTPVAWSAKPGGPLEGLEMHLSWYPRVGLSRTFDHQEEIGPGLLSLGMYENQETLTACFDCHTTGLHVAADGRPDIASFLPGVRCDKCHEGAREHLASDGETAMGRWSELTPIASIEKCGACHRTASSPAVQKYERSDPKLSRFAPVGLSRSACFVRQGERRLDCMTCHDPHQPPPTGDDFYTSKCVDCHSSVASACTDQPMTSNCLPCHMPKRQLDLHLAFTDHWIRILDPDDEAAAETAQAESID